MQRKVLILTKPNIWSYTSYSGVIFVIIRHMVHIIETVFNVFEFVFILSHLKWFAYIERGRNSVDKRSIGLWFHARRQGCSTEKYPCTGIAYALLFLLFNRLLLLIWGFIFDFSYLQIKANKYIFVELYNLLHERLPILVVSVVLEVVYHSRRKHDLFIFFNLRKICVQASLKEWEFL